MVESLFNMKNTSVSWLTEQGYETDFERYG